MWKYFIGLLTVLSFPLTVLAANCGGSVVCKCGDTVTTSYVMPGPLVCSAGHGLRVADGLTLNCNGHTLTGVSLPGTYGIYLDQTDGAFVTGCGILSWDRGLRLNNAHDNTIQNVYSAVNGNPVTHVGYGIDLAGGSSRNVFLQVSSIANADEGVHVGTGANENIFYQGGHCGNFRENLYFLSNRDNVVHSVETGYNCYGYLGGSNAVYQRDGTHNHFISNTFRERSFHTTGDSAGTVLYQNTFLDGAVYKESCYAPSGQCPYLTIKVP